MEETTPIEEVTTETPEVTSEEVTPEVDTPAETVEPEVAVEPEA